jgi:hypothetical protein
MRFHSQDIKTQSIKKNSWLFDFEGGGRLKFGDVVICVASIAVISALIHAPLDLMFVSAFGLTLGYTASVVVSFFVSTLIAGYIFAGKIWEARREAILKIAALWASLVILILRFLPAQAQWGLLAQEAYQGQYGTPLSTIEWVHWEIMYLDIFVFIFVVVALVLGLIGLYVGSMLRTPKKA